MRPVPAVAVTQCGAFTTRQALHAGWTSHALRHAVARGQLRRPRPGTYAVSADDPTVRLRADAAAFSLTNPDVPVSHGSAGAVLGLQLLTGRETVCATFPRSTRGPMTGVHRHRGRLAARDLGRKDGVVLTRPARTVLDSGREHGADAAIVAADSALRLRLTEPSFLHRTVLATAGWPGVAGAHRALRLADAAAESALESLSRLRMADADLPAPRLQVPIRDLDGRFLGRPDFLWDEFGVVGEADGVGKYPGRPDSLAAEKRRQAAFERVGLIVVRWLWSDLFAFGAVVAELLDAFGRGLRPDRAPRRWMLGPT